jgi:hypothetical protein
MPVAYDEPEPYFEPQEWRTREHWRMVHGRQRTIWEVSGDFWQRYGHVCTHHFLHVCPDDPRLVAYTASTKDGMRDIQTKIRPGRYLMEFFGTVMPPAELKRLAEWQQTGCYKSGYENEPLHFAHTPAEIARVYLNGPHSCMRKRWSIRNHPCGVYGAGDLAVAWIQTPAKLLPPRQWRRIGSTEGWEGLLEAKQINHAHQPRRLVLARALCWPEKKVFNRVYPTSQNWLEDGFIGPEEAQAAQIELYQRLLALGWTDCYMNRNTQGLQGARLLKLQADPPRSQIGRLGHFSRPRWRMPYVDGAWLLQTDPGNPDLWRLTQSGQQAEFSPTTTCGFV